MRKYLLIVAITPVLFGLTLLSKKSNDSIRIIYIFPDDYTGIVEVHSNQAEGIDVEPIDETYVFNFPKSGILKIKGNDPIHKWHELEIKYANGQKIPKVSVINPVNPEDTALRSFAANKNLNIYVLGTAFDLEQEKGRHPETIPKLSPENIPSN